MPLSLSLRGRGSTSHLWLTPALRERRSPLAEPGLWKQVFADVRQRPESPHCFSIATVRSMSIPAFPDVPPISCFAKTSCRSLTPPNDADLPVVIVTNQSGIARGMFGWKEFAAVNARVVEALEERGMPSSPRFWPVLITKTESRRLALPIIQCGSPILACCCARPKRLKLDLARSIIVGDKTSDMEAGQRAGLPRGWLVDGEGSKQPGFEVLQLRDSSDLNGLLSAVGSLGSD